MTDQGSYIALASSWGEDAWFRFPRAFIRDAQLSATARAIAAWMASHSDRFRFDVPTMVRANLGGRDKVRNALKELEKRGYLVRRRERNEDGSYGRILYELHPVPQTEQPSISDRGKARSQPGPENQGPGVQAPAPENQAVGSTCEDDAKQQVSASAWKSGPDFQGSFQGEQGRKREEGEEVARAGANTGPSQQTSPSWGVAGHRRPSGPSLAAADLVASIAGEVLMEGEQLTATEHQELAALVEQVHPVVEDQPGLSWQEYRQWLHQGWLRPDGRPAYKSFRATLTWRLKPEQVRDKAWVWACERRGAQEASEARGKRSQRQSSDSEHADFCGEHRLRLLEGKCAACEEYTREQDQLWKSRATRSHGDTVAEEPVVEEFSEEFAEQFQESLNGEPTERAPRPRSPWGALKGQVDTHSHAEKARRLLEESRNG